MLIGSLSLLSRIALGVLGTASGSASLCLALVVAVWAEGMSQLPGLGLRQ